MAKRDTILEAGVFMRRIFQEARMQTDNRIRAAKAGGEDSAGLLRELEAYSERLSAQEQFASERVSERMEDSQIGQRMMVVKGVGPMLAAQIIAEVDIEMADTVSALWRYAGYAVDDGKAERRKRGEKIHYNPRLKKIMFVLATSFLRSSSPYRRVYDDARDYYALNRPEWTKAHCHYAAIRKMMKMFLSHLWLVWRELEGLPITAPYAQQVLGHSEEHISQPAEFGWDV